jgi:hypothetical protein
LASRLVVGGSRVGEWLRFVAGNWSHVWPAGNFRGGTRTCLQRLPENSIVMGDANFGIFSMAYEAQQTGHSFLLRLTKSRFQSLRKKATLVSQGEDSEICSLRWTPSARERKTNPHLPAEAAIQVRLHTVKVHEKLTLWMVTNLPEDGWELASLYKQRNDLEIDIRNLKVVLDAEHIRARSEAMFRKELYTSIVSYNLMTQFRRQAAQLAQLPTRRLSFTSVWNTYREFLLKGWFTTPAQWRERYRIALHYAMRDVLPNRPGRSYEREAYPKRPKSDQFKKRKKPPSHEEKMGDNTK